MSEASLLRQRAHRLAAAQAVLDREEIEEHLALSPGERLLRTVQLSEAHLVACPPTGTEVDDEAETWRRVHDYLHSLPS